MRESSLHFGAIWATTEGRFDDKAFPKVVFAQRGMTRGCEILSANAFQPLDPFLLILWKSKRRLLFSA